MTYSPSQWVVIIIHNFGAKPLKLKNLRIYWGKLHADGDKNKEVPASKYEGKVIGPDEKLQINASALPDRDAVDGTAGDFDLVDPRDSDKTIRHFYWDCQWGKTNTWTVTGSNSKWVVEYRGQQDRGPLGIIYVDVLGNGA